MQRQLEQAVPDYIDNAIPGPAVGRYCMSVKPCLSASRWSSDGGTIPAQKAAIGTSLDCRQKLPWG